ncbi:MAG: S41 family peptidase [Psychrosphaera sp.]|nr:S41 family peptidase [Psychrosphaera sp.]
MAYPRNSVHWNGAEQQTIDNFLPSFTPQWSLPQGKFSDWHFSVVSPAKTHYNKSVTVLMDAGNFSASDIFLAAFKGTKNVTLVGAPSSGGSEFARVVFFPRSGLFYLQSQMASFQPNGQLYEGTGVMPDVRVEAVLRDYINDKDRGLTLALKMLTTL